MGARKGAWEPSDVASASAGPWPVKPRRVVSTPWSGASVSFPAEDSAACARCRDASSGQASAAPLDVDPRRRGCEGAPAPSWPSRCRRAGRAERASAREPGFSYTGRGSGGQRSCSRIELVAEVDEQRSATEGVLARIGLPSLTRRRLGRARRPEAMGMRQSRIRRRRTRTSEVRVASPSCGREHRRREV